MTTRVRFVLSYDFLNTLYTLLSPLKVDIFPMKINIVVTDVVNDLTYFRKSVNTRVVITLLLHDVIHWKTATSYDKLILSFFIFKTWLNFNGCLSIGEAGVSIITKYITKKKKIKISLIYLSFEIFAWFPKLVNTFGTGTRILPQIF